MLLIKKDGIIFGSTDAKTGNAKNKDVRAAALSAAGLSETNLVTCNQVHGDEVALVQYGGAKMFPDTDGLITREENVVLGVFTADCMPIFLYEPEHKAVGVLHAGWRGAVKGIARKSLQLMKRSWHIEPSKMQAYLGPHIQACCFEVGSEVAAQFPGHSKEENGILRVSLAGAVRQQLEECGILSANIVQSPWCTFREPDFFSYRRNRTEQRMLSFISRA